MVSRSLMVIAYFLGATSFNCAAVNMGDLVNLCSLKDPILDECLTNQGRAILPRLVAGVSEWKFPSMTPLILPLLRLERTGGPLLSLSVNVTNSTHAGWPDVIIRTIKFDSKAYILYLEWIIPSYKGSGVYEVQGNVLQVPISGRGFATAVSKDVFMSLTVKFQPDKRNGNTFMKMIHADSKVKINNLKLKVDNLFGNKFLSDIMNYFLNSNSLLVFGEVKPYMETINAETISSVIKGIFSTIPYTQLFRDVD